MNYTCGCGQHFTSSGALLSHVREGCDQQSKDEK